MTRLLTLLGCLLMLSSAQAINSSTAPAKNRPTPGMTKDAVRAYYGEPYNRAVVDGNERWYYYLKYAEVYGRAYVPFRFSSKDVYLGSITFGREGKVKTVDWFRFKGTGAQ